jgi:PRC-barrel domain
MAEDLWKFQSGVGQERADLRGLSVEAIDGSIGKVKDVVDESGRAFLLVDTGPWILGKTVMLPAGVVVAIDVDDEKVTVDRTKDEIKSAPEYDDDLRDDASYGDALTRHYGAAKPQV